MSCCVNHTAGAKRCFGWMSKRYARRYERKGLDESQQSLVGWLEQAGLEGQSLLDVGCGVGALHQTLLERGAARALGVDLADKMLEFARERAAKRGLEGRVRYELGDFVDVHSRLEDADIILLDKVVCCTPTPREMLAAAVRRTRRAIALTFPRKHWLSELGTAIWNFGFWLLRSDFRSYVHDPASIDEWLQDHGLHRSFDQETLLWHAWVYELDTEHSRRLT